MRNVLLSLTLCLTAPVFSNTPPVHYTNQESGFSLILPEGLKHSWNIRNFDIGLEINVFMETDYNYTMQEFFAVVAQLPLNCNSCFDELEFMSMVLGELDDMPIGKVYIEKDGYILQAVQMPTVGLEDIDGKRMRVYLMDDTDGLGVAADMQFFVRGHHAFMVLTGVLPVEEASDLEEFTQEVFQSIRFDGNKTL